MKADNEIVSKVVDALFAHGKVNYYWVSEDLVAAHMKIAGLDKSHYEEVCGRLEDAGISVGAKREGVYRPKPIRLPDNTILEERFLYKPGIQLYPSLTASEEERLARKGKTNPLAKELLVCSNIRLALFLAYCHSMGGEKADTMELFISALPKLVEAANQYDPDCCGLRFRTYAGAKINRYLKSILK